MLDRIRRVTRTKAIEADICIIGSGISAAMVADRLARTTKGSIVVLEAGDDVPPVAERDRLRRRLVDYGENPWLNDHLEGYEIEGPLQSRSMGVGGLAMHWGGVTPRFSPEDFRLQSMFGVGADWPLSYDELDPFYQEAEELLGVAGEQGPAAMDPRGKPFPLPALPLTYNLSVLKDWTTKAGITMWSQPSAKNSIPYHGRPQCCRNDTCSPICPIGAKYSPDFTWKALRTAKRVTLHTRTLVRRLVLDEKTSRISHAVAVHVPRLDPHATPGAMTSAGEPIEIHARQFVVAGGYVWSSHLLLISATDRASNGIANSSGNVGRYLGGHRNVQAFIELPVKLYPGLNEQHSLVTKQFMRVKPRSDGKYLRHDLRVWESQFARGPRISTDDGRVLLGDDVLRDWRDRTKTGTTRVRAYYDVIPDRDSALTLDQSRINMWGDPLPKLAFRDAPESAGIRGWSEDQLRALVADMARAGDGKVLRTEADDDNFQDHPAGGCRMGTDAATSVTNSFGRTHDHENLFVVGAPTCPTASCANATLTFCALSLRSAAEIARG